MQTSFSELAYARKKKVTRRDRFLSQIDAVTPWAALVSALASDYPKSDKRGRPTIGLERMLRMVIVQQCFGLSGEGIEDAIYDSQAIRRFIGIDLNQGLSCPRCVLKTECGAATAHSGLIRCPGDHF